MRRLRVTGWLLVLLFGLALLVTGSVQAAPTARSSFWVPRIAVVWPHDEAGQPAPVATAPLINVSVWPAADVHCFLPPDGLTLYLARGNEPAVPVEQVPALILREYEGRFFPALEYNDIPVTRNAEGQVDMRFYAQQWASYSNVWVHGTDGRTRRPEPLTVIEGGTLILQPSVFIQRAFPHDDVGVLAPVDQAPFVNLTTEVIATDGNGGWLPVAGFDPLTRPSSQPLTEAPTRPVLGAFMQLLAASGNQPLQRSTGIRPVVSLEQRSGAAPQIPYLVLVQNFNDIPVDPGQPTHFLIDTGSAKLPSTIWSHASDARTMMPTPPVPAQCYVPRGTSDG